MIKKLLVYFLISTFVFVPHKLSTLAQKECKDGICETSMDNLLNYPPNIPSMHKISFLDGQITPDVHFVDKNGQKKFCFFS